MKRSIVDFGMCRGGFAQQYVLQKSNLFVARITHPAGYFRQRPAATATQAAFLVDYTDAGARRLDVVHLLTIQQMDDNPFAARTSLLPRGEGYGDEGASVNHSLKRH